MTPIDEITYDPNFYLKERREQMRFELIKALCSSSELDGWTAEGYAKTVVSRADAVLKAMEEGEKKVTPSPLKR